MSEDFKVDKTQAHLHKPGNRLGPEVLTKLESSLTEVEKKVYDEITSKTTVRFWNRRKHDTKVGNLAFTYNYSTHSDMWLAPDDPDLKDTFMHELGQVLMGILGYRNAVARYYDRPTSLIVASYAVNAFIGATAELQLEKKGVDRTYYKTRDANSFRVFMDSVQTIDLETYDMSKRIDFRCQLFYIYVAIKLNLREKFEPLEAIWYAKIKVPELRMMAKKIYKEASAKEITPERYNELQRFFAKTVGYEDWIIVKKPYGST